MALTRTLRARVSEAEEIAFHEAGGADWLISRIDRVNLDACHARAIFDAFYRPHQKRNKVIRVRVAPEAHAKALKAGGSRWVRREIAMASGEGDRRSRLSLQPMDVAG